MLCTYWNLIFIVFVLLDYCNCNVFLNTMQNVITVCDCKKKKKNSIAKYSTCKSSGFKMYDDKTMKEV